MKERDSWFIKIWEHENPGVFGIGEAGPLPGLSKELDEDYEQHLSDKLSQFNNKGIDMAQIKKNDLAFILNILNESIIKLEDFPSILFALETALLDLINGGSHVIFNNSFVGGKSIPINGLIWMSGMDMMLQQIEIKIQEGFNCLKLKVGGLDFEKECDILQYIRRKYFKMDIAIRLDANGAFKSEEALYKLEELSKFDIHSIEQPVAPGSSDMVDLCKQSPIPIALDEELIGVDVKKDGLALLGKIKPKFIILKPSLHGGMSGCREWITLAEESKIGWWMTSALESSIGLNAIAQFTAEFDNELHQGLGTGKIYDNNIESPLVVDKGTLSYSDEEKWVLPNFD